METDEENVLSNSESKNQHNIFRLRTCFKQSLPEFLQESSSAWVDVVNKTVFTELPEEFEIMSPISPCEQFMLILDGHVRVYQHTPDDREVTLYRLGPGDVCVLSINGLLHRKAYGAFAKSESKLQTLIFSKEQFFEAMGISETFRNYVLTSVSDRFNDLLELMETTVFESLDTRLICLLGKMTRASSTNTIHITHQELARELGTSREVISRVLKGLEQRGCIKLSRGMIQVQL